MISNCGHDEHGRYSGGQAGDQTGNEWSIIPWYNRPWNYVIRFENPAIAERIAYNAKAAAQNNRVGYDQNERGTYWSHLKASNYDPAQITVNCEADCSAGVAANVKAAGFTLGIVGLQKVDTDAYTGNIRRVLQQAGARVLTDSKYLTSDAYLKAGDILLYENHHVATNLTNGAKSGATSTPTQTTGGSGYMFNVSNVKMGSTGKSVTLLEKLLTYHGFYKGKIDGESGTGVVKAINDYQNYLRTKCGIDVGTNGKADGECGAKMWATILGV